MVNKIEDCVNEVVAAWAEKGSSLKEKDIKALGEYASQVRNIADKKGVSFQEELMADINNRRRKILEQKEAFAARVDKTSKLVDDFVNAQNSGVKADYNLGSLIDYELSRKTKNVTLAAKEAQIKHISHKILSDLQTKHPSIYNRLIGKDLKPDGKTVDYTFTHMVSDYKKNPKIADSKWLNSPHKGLIADAKIAADYINKVKRYELSAKRLAGIDVADKQDIVVSMVRSRDKLNKADLKTFTDTTIKQLDDATLAEYTQKDGSIDYDNLYKDLNTLYDKSRKEYIPFELTSEGDSILFGASKSEKLRKGRKWNFKDGAAEFEHRRLFGQGDNLIEMVMGDIEYNARYLAKVEKFGPNPEAGIRMFLQKAREKATDVEEFDRAASRFNEGMDIWEGKKNPYINDPLQTFLDFSNLLVEGKLSPMSALQGVLMDNVLNAVTSTQMGGGNVFTMFKNLGDTYSKSLTNLLPSERVKFIAEIGGNLHDFAKPYKDMVRLSGDRIEGEGFINWARRKQMELTYITQSSSSNRGTFFGTKAIMLGEYKGYGYSELPKALIQELSRAGVSAEKWDLIREKMMGDFKGASVANPNQLRDFITDQSILIDKTTKITKTNFDELANTLKGTEFYTKLQERLSTISDDSTKAKVFRDEVSSELRSIRKKKLKELKVLDDASSALYNFLKDQSEIASPSPNTWHRRALKFGGSTAASSRIINTLSKYKGYGTAVGYSMIRVGQMGSANAGISGAMVALSQAFFGLTLAGAAASLARDVWNNRNPSDNFTNEESFKNFMVDAMTTGGALSFLGDMIGAEYSGNGRSFAKDLLGPTLGTYADMIDMANKAISLDLTEENFPDSRLVGKLTKQEVTGFAQRQLPHTLFARTLYNMFLDQYVRNLVDPVGNMKRNFRHEGRVQEGKAKGSLYQMGAGF